MSDKPEKMWHRKCPADCGADYCDIIEDKQRTDDSTEYIRADLAKPSEWISVEKLSEAKSLLNELMTHHVVSNSTLGQFLKGYKENDLYRRVNEFIASPPTRETP